MSVHLRWQNILNLLGQREHVDDGLSLLYVVAKESHLPHLFNVLSSGMVDLDRLSRSTNFGYAMQAACCWGHGHVVRCLVKNGADVNVHVGDQGHAVITAIEGKHYDIARYLQECGGSPPQPQLNHTLVTMVARTSV